MPNGYKFVVQSLNNNGKDTQANVQVKVIGTFFGPPLLTKLSIHQRIRLTLPNSRPIDNSHTFF